MLRCLNSQQLLEPLLLRTLHLQQLCIALQQERAVQIAKFLNDQRKR
jgi:hypothetical protein